MKTLKLWATLAALILAASTAGAAVVDMGDALGPSGGYSSRAYYQAMLGGQPMTAAQQAYANDEDQLRQLGFQAELGGDFALGQMFYHIAYGIAPPPSIADAAGGASGLDPSSIAADGLAGGSSAGPPAPGPPVLPARAPLTFPAGTGARRQRVNPDALADPGTGFVIAVPEPSTWVLMLLGFGALGYVGWRGARKAALHAA